MTFVRLYGRLFTQSSLSVVTEGFRSVLSAEGLLTGLYGVDSPNKDDDDAIDGVNARHGVYTGPLDRVGEMFEKGRHAYYWVMIAPNSNLLPTGLVRQLRDYDKRFPGQVRFMAPSKWAGEVVREHLAGCDIVVPHGVSREYAVNPELVADTTRAYNDGEFRVLHFSTSAQERKGTLELIKAWVKLPERLFKQERPLLNCILDYPAKLALQERLLDEGIRLGDTVKLNARADLPPENMARVLGSAHVVCQPSRGEAFGLVPLQALCCGVPVVATVCTGHTEYLKSCPPGLMPVPTYASAPLDDLPGSMAPSLKVEELRSSLESARRHYLTLQIGAVNNASRLQEEWSWFNQLKPFVRKLREG